MPAKKAKTKKTKPIAKGKAKQKEPAINELQESLQKPKEPTNNDVEELLSPLRQIDLKLQRALQDLPKSYVVLALIKVQEYSATNIELIKYLAKQGIPGVFVSVNKPLEEIVESVPQQLIEKSNIEFIDCVSRISGTNEVQGKNFHYVDSANDLVELTEAMEETMEKLKEQEKFAIIDSVSTLLIYNKEEAIERFVHAIAGKLRNWKAKGIFIMVESAQTKSIAEALGQFCDKVIEIG
jgi:hypothetical protein